jgi:hypothetical protein
VHGIFAEPPEDLIAACRKAGLSTFDQGYIHFGGPRGKWAPDKALEAPSATGKAWYGNKAPLPPVLARRAEKAPFAKADVSAFDRLFADTSLQRHAASLESASAPPASVEEAAMARERARQRFDPARRFAEAVEPPPPRPSTSLAPYSPGIPSSSPPAMGRTKTSREVELVRSGRLPAGAIVGMMELRRRRVAAQRALARGERVARDRAPRRVIQSKPFVGISREYEPEVKPTFSPRQSLKRMRKIAAQKWRPAGPPGSYVKVSLCCPSLPIMTDAPQEYGGVDGAESNQGEGARSGDEPAARRADHHQGAFEKVRHPQRIRSAEAAAAIMTQSTLYTYYHVVHARAVQAKRPTLTPTPLSTLPL